MGIVARLLTISVALAVLIGAAFEAVRQGVVGSAVSNASRELDRLASAPDTESGRWWRDDLWRATNEYRGNPAARELLALVKMKSNEPADLQTAEQHLAVSIEGRPGSGYTWANYMAVKYRLGQVDAAFEKALAHAVALAPYEPEVQRAVVDLGLAVMNEVGPETRRAIERMVAAGMKRKAPEILQIASRRGRLDAACRHLDGVPRPAASKWTQLCQSMEQTS